MHVYVNNLKACKYVSDLKACKYVSDNMDLKIVSNFSNHDSSIVNLTSAADPNSITSSVDANISNFHESKGKFVN
jgi:hypothetical protein